METRAPIGPSPRDQPHLCAEPFVVNVLNKGEQDGRIANWYVALLDEDLYEDGPAVEKDCESELFDYQAAKEEFANIPSSCGLLMLAIQLITKTRANSKDPGNRRVCKVSEGEGAELGRPEDIDDGLSECEVTGANGTGEGGAKGKGKSTALRGIGSSGTEANRCGQEDTTKPKHNR